MRACTFCRIVAGELEASVVYRDEHCWAFMDIQPVNSGHALVIPTAHVTRLADLDPENGAQLFRVSQRIAAALLRGAVRCEGVNLFLADGEVAGQDVSHVHLHVIPRFAGDGFGLRLPQHYGLVPPREELDRVARAIRGRL
ncbi:MAG: HIT family protein [Anaerolineae bacterium]|nr:HIT family protein [Anaerolineae bacterium]